MKRVFSLLALFAAIILSSCQGGLESGEQPGLTIDKAIVEFEQEKYTLPAGGGEVIIPVVSTGIDFATIRYSFEDSWDFDINGNMVPRDGWISLTVIPNYPESRLLPQGRSGVQLTVKPNERISGRSATLIIGSFNLMKSVQLYQPSPYEEK